MKQHITEKQFNELGDDQKERYYELSSSMFYIVVTKGISVTNGKTSKVNYSVPMWSIGQLIEFLGDDLGCFNSEYDETSDINFSKWLVQDNSKLFQEQELCDALWEAVKEKLK